MNSFVSGLIGVLATIGVSAGGIAVAVNTPSVQDNLGLSWKDKDIMGSNVQSQQELIINNDELSGQLDNLVSDNEILVDQVNGLLDDNSNLQDKVDELENKLENSILIDSNHYIKKFKFDDGSYLYYNPSVVGKFYYLGSDGTYKLISRDVIDVSWYTNVYKCDEENYIIFADELYPSAGILKYNIVDHSLLINYDDTKYYNKEYVGNGQFLMSSNSSSYSGVYFLSSYLDVKQVCTEGYNYRIYKVTDDKYILSCNDANYIYTLGDDTATEIDFNKLISSSYDLDNFLLIDTNELYLYNKETSVFTGLGVYGDISKVSKINAENKCLVAVGKFLYVLDLSNLSITGITLERDIETVNIIEYIKDDTYYISWSNGTHNYNGFYKTSISEYTEIENVFKNDKIVNWIYLDDTTVLLFTQTLTSYSNLYKLYLNDLTFEKVCQFDTFLTPYKVELIGDDYLLFAASQGGVYCVDLNLNTYSVYADFSRWSEFDLFEENVVIARTTDASYKNFYLKIDYSNGITCNIYIYM